MRFLRYSPAVSKGLKVSVIPSPPLPSPSEVKCLFHDQHSFLKQGESAVGGDIVVKDSLCRVGYLTFKVAP